MEKEILAYTAGLLDGEGCIKIKRDKKIKRRGDICHTLEVEIANTDYGVIEWLKTTFGGTTHSVMNQNNHGWRQCWRWRLSCRRASEFLREVLPYTKIKTPQINIALSFQSGLIFKSWSMTEDELNRREHCCMLLSELKKR